MKAKRILRKDEKAVSPVIGVILMVAITVILAAVIAAFVFGMGSTLKKTYVVAATASHVSTNKITITYNGGPDADFVTYLNVSVNEQKLNSTGGIGSWPTWGTGAGGSVQVGNSTSFTSDTYVYSSKTNHVVAVARFTDASEQVILDSQV